MKKPTVVNCILVALAGLVSYYLISLIIALQPQPNPQTEVTRELLTPKITVDEPIRIRVGVTRTRSCPTFVHTWFINANNDVVMNQITSSPFSNVVGKASAVIDQSSHGLPPGKYKIMANGVIDCGLYGSFVAPNPELEVEIVGK